LRSGEQIGKETLLFVSYEPMTTGPARCMGQEASDRFPDPALAGR
jgi:hypothetical protein